MKKKIITVLSGVMLFGSVFGAGVFASPHLQEIKAYLNGDLKIRVNGKIAQLNNENGSAVLPITYNGTTYLPVRGVANLLNVAVHYDPQAYEVILGELLEGVAVNQEKFGTSSLYSKDPAHTNFADKDYGEVYYSGVGTNVFTSFFYPEGKYQKLYLQVAAIEKDIDYVEIKDHHSKALLKRVEGVTIEDGMITIEADIAGTKTLVVEVRKNRSGGYIIPLTTSYYK